MQQWAEMGQLLILAYLPRIIRAQPFFASYPTSSSVYFQISFHYLVSTQIAKYF